MIYNSLFIVIKCVVVCVLCWRCALSKAAFAAGATSFW